MIAWVLPAIGFAVFAVIACANASILFKVNRKTTASAEEGQGSSFIPFVGGVIGAIAVGLAPLDPVRAFFWVPLLLDVGCIPALVLALPAVFSRSFGARASDPELAEANARLEAKQQADAKAHLGPLEGCLLGTAVGDALGLPYEGLSPQRRARLFPAMDRYHLLPFGRGLCSDDTEHTVMVAQALMQTAQYAQTSGDAEAFHLTLASAMRLWLLGLPAGIGMATLKSILKLWLFLPQRWQGTFSAGNAPAMRSALIGVFWGEDPKLMRMHVRASTRLTHTDPKAEQAALAVAMAASMSARCAGRGDALDYARQMRSTLGAEGTELAALIDKVAASVQAAETTQAFAAGMGLGKGVTGYSFHTVPVALHAWLAHPGDYRGAVLAAIECGGDTDTVAAIAGAIVGAGVGREGVPAEWVSGLVEWPRSVRWMRALAASLAQTRATFHWNEARPTSAFKLAVRNVFFLSVVLLHGFRRLLPPY